MENTKIYKPRAWTRELHESKIRWKVIVAHRRAGKSTACLNHLLREAILIPQSRYAYIAPTYKQSKNIAWDILKEYASKVSGATFNEAELRCDLLNGSRITLYGADNPDSLRGMGLWGVVFDEYSQQPSNIFTEIIRPALSDHQGFAIWIGTPKGKNEFWKLYEYGKKDDKWLSMLFNVDDTDIISESEIEDAKKIMSDDEFQQEFYCSFSANIKGAYYAKEIEKARKEKRIGIVPHDIGLPVITFWDLGMADSTAIGFFQKTGLEWRMIDYYEASGESLAHYAKVLKDKNYLYSAHYAPHDIEVRELGTGKSRLEIARELGINFLLTPNIPIEDGIGSVRMMFGYLWIDEEKCSQFIHNISLYRKEWDDKRGTFKDRALHDFTSHSADVLRYWAVTEKRTLSFQSKKLNDDDFFFNQEDKSFDARNMFPEI